MTTGIDDLDFSGSVGADVAQEAMKGGDFQRKVEYLSLKGDPASIAAGKNQGVYRFLTDSVRRDPNAPLTKFNLAWITAAGHYANTKPRPPYAREGQNWPGKMGGGCRKDPIFAARFQGQCPVCDQGNKPSKQVWALAVERQEVRNDQGQVIGFVDKTREVFSTDEQGNLIEIGKDGDKPVYQKETVPAYVVMSQGWKNFFQPLSGHAAYYGSLLNADWHISRTGTENNDTVYTPIRMETIKIPGENPWGIPDGTIYDLAYRFDDGTTLMEKIYPDMPDLRKILLDRVSDEYLGRWFIPGWMPEGFDPNAQGQNGQQQQGQPMQQGAGMQMVFSQGGTPAAGQQQAPQTPAAQPTEEPPASALSALQNRVMGGAQGGQQ